MPLYETAMEGLGRGLRRYPDSPGSTYWGLGLGRGVFEGLRVETMGLGLSADDLSLHVLPFLLLPNETEIKCKEHPW